MRSCRALLYCTVNGICNNTNGLGRQAKTLLSVLDKRDAELAALAGPFDVHVACPQPGPHTWAYDPADLRYAQAVVGAHGGQVHPLPYETDRPFWSVPTWQALCTQAALCAAGLAERYAELIVVGVDTPFAGLGAAIRRHEPRTSCQIHTLLAFYSTALIVEHPAASSHRITWEQRGIETANRQPDVWVADIGDYLSEHLQQEYRLDRSRLVPFPSSLDLASSDLQPMPGHAARKVIAEWGIPSDRPVVLTVGRTDPVKGIDLLIHALEPLRDQVHAVIIAVAYEPGHPLIGEYEDQIAAAGLRASLVTAFTRELPRALCSLPVTRVVACPSRGETLANVPFEVALWARDGGPVVAAPRRSGFLEQIHDGVTGLLYDCQNDSTALTAAIARGISMSAAQRTRMIAAAHARVRRERDMVPNLAQALRFFWHTSPSKK